MLTEALTAAPSLRSVGCVDSDWLDDAVLRRLADHTELALLTEVAAAVTGGTAALQNLDRAVHMGISTEPMPVLLKGRDLTSLGVEQGPSMGEAMRAVRHAQIEGQVSDREEAIVWLKDYLT